MLGKVKRQIKSALAYVGDPNTKIIRDAIDEDRRDNWPYAPPDEGDLLYRLSNEVAGQQALEIGFATGSTASYILLGDAARLTSIDFAQDNFHRAGEKLVSRMGFAGRHTLVEMNSIIALPEMLSAGNRFGLVFLDGWKTFDHVWVDTFYSVKMLNCGGFIIFDDANMPAVRKCISILIRYYGFQSINSYNLVGGIRQRLWHFMTMRSVFPPYRVLRKTVEIQNSEAGVRYDFWTRF